MKKSLSIILIITLIIGGILAGLPSKVYAYQASMYASSRNVTVDDNVSVTVSFGRGVSAAQFSLTYSSQLEYIGKSTGTYDTGTKQFGFFGANDDISSVTFTFKAKETGKATVSANGVSLTYGEDTYGESAGSASTTITINPKSTPTPEPPKPTTPPEPTRTPDEPNNNDNNNNNENPNITDIPEEPTQTPTPTPEPTEEPNNEENKTNEENTDNEQNKEKAPNQIIKIDENNDIKTIKDEEKDIMIKAKSIAIKEDDVTLSVTLIEEETERFNDLTKMTKSIKGNKKFYDIKLLKDGLAVETNGYVTVYLPIPEGYNKDRLEAYSINEQTEKYEKRDGEVQGNYYTFTTDKLEAFALVEKEANTKSSKIKNIIIMVLGAMIILAVIAIIIKKMNESYKK